MVVTFCELILSPQVGLNDMRHFTDVKPIRFFDRSIDIKGEQRL